MLLINFICLFYLMVLVRCDTISKSAANKDLFDESDQLNVLLTLQDVSDPVSQSSSRLPRLRKQKKPWIYRVPLNNYQSTAALENILENIKYNNIKQIASSPLGSTGMVFVVTQPGYVMEESDSSNTGPNILNRENKFSNTKDTEDTTTELDEMILLDSLRWEGKNKRRTEDEVKNASETEHKKEMVKRKFRFKDIFKYFQPNKHEKEITVPHIKNKQDLLNEVPVLLADDVKADVTHHAKTNTKLSSVGSTRNVTEKIKRSKCNKGKKPIIRHQRGVNTKESLDNHKWLPKFMKRDPHLQEFESTVYEKLSNKLAYKDFVDGFKYYLNFERDMAKSNFSDMVRYQAHMHHNVDDIGKFILDKLPSVPITTESKSSCDQPSQEDYEDTDNPLQAVQSTYKTGQSNENADIDYDMNLDKYDDKETTTYPSTPYAFNLLKKRLIDFRKPFWLSKSNSYSDSKTRSPRVRRHGIRFDKTQFPHSLKTERAQRKEVTKKVGFAKVSLVEAPKSNKPFKSLFSKIKKHHSKREIQREVKYSFFDKLRDLFSNHRTTTYTTKASAYNTESYDFQSHLYDIMKGEDLLGMEEKIHEQSRQNKINRFSLDDYGTEPLTMTSTLSSIFHIETDIPFELSTPTVTDPGLRKELHQLQRTHDYLSAKFESALNPSLETSMPRPSLLKEIEDEVNKANQWSSKLATSKMPTRHHEHSQSHDDAKDLRENSNEKKPQLTFKLQDTNAITRPMFQRARQLWEIVYPELKDIQKEYHLPKPSPINEIELNKQLKDTAQSWRSFERELINNKLKEHHSPKQLMWHNANDLGVKNLQIEYRNNLKDLSQTGKSNSVKFKNKLKQHHMSKIGQQKYNRKLVKELVSSTWKSNGPEFKNKDFFPSTSDISANHFNIKPGMFNDLNFDELGFRITGWPDNLNSNDFTTNRMTTKAEKVPEFDKTEQAVKDVFKNWSETPAVLEVKTSKMPVNIKNIREFYRQGQTMSDVRYRVTPGSYRHNIDIPNRHLIKEFINESAPEKKVFTNDEGDGHYYVAYDEEIDDDIPDDKQSITFENKTVEKVKLKENDDDALKQIEKIEKMTPKQNNLLYTTVSPYKTKNAIITTGTKRELEGKSSLYTRPVKLTQLKGEYKHKTTGENCKQKQSWPHDLLEVTTSSDKEDTKSRQKPFDFEISVTSGVRGSSSMSDKFNLVFPKFTPMTEADGGALVKKWFDKHPDFVPIGALNKEKSAVKSNLPKTSFEKHNKQNKKTNVTKAIKNPKYGIKEIPKFVTKEIPEKETITESITPETTDIGHVEKDWLEVGELPKSESKEIPGKEIFTVSENPEATDIRQELGQIEKDWLEVEKLSKLDSKEIPGKGKSTVSVKPTTNNNEKMETLDLGKMVKDWLDSFDPDLAKTTTLTTKSSQAVNKEVHKEIHKELHKEKDKEKHKEIHKELHKEAGTSKDKGHIVKHKAFNFKDLLEANKSDGKIILNEVPEQDKVYDYMKNTFPNDEPTTAPESYIHLFESVPTYEPVKTHEYGPQLTLPENFGHTNLGVHLKSAPKKSDKEKTKKYSKEREQKSLPKNFEIVKTFDIIYTAKGDTPSVNESINKVATLFQKYSNLRKRNLRKSHMRSTILKTPTRSSKRQKRRTGTSEDSKTHEVCSRGGVEKRAQNPKNLPKEQHTVDFESQGDLQDGPTGSCILIVDCTARLPRGNYLVKPLAPGRFQAVVSNEARIPDFKVEIINEASNCLTANPDSTKVDEKGEQEKTNDNRMKRSCTCQIIEKLFSRHKLKCKCKPIAKNQDILDDKTDKVKRDLKRKIENHLSWKKIRQWFHGERACSCKCKPHQTMCKACAASDAVMGEVIFRLNSLVSFINAHKAEIESYFSVNLKGAQEFRKAVRETDKCLENYSKRVGKCHGKLCEAFKYVEDRSVTDSSD